MSFDPSRLVSQLSAMDKEEGNIKLKCQGEVVKAHSLILSMRYSNIIMQEYFKEYIINILCTL